MDPNANLAEQRVLMLRIIQHDASHDDLTRDALRLAELVEALDGWIKGGGFLPKDWQRGPQRGLFNALSLLVLTPHIKHYLTQNDPKALEQAVAALQQEGI